jgi:WD40 repeat protein
LARGLRTLWLANSELIDIAFSPNSPHVATVAEDGFLRIMDLQHERLIDSYSSYFGALTCVCWSPDGRFVLTGGQDDLLTLYSPYDGRVVARCQGHSSFVSACGFDKVRCVEGKVYRFGSVGEDGRFLLVSIPPLIPSLSSNDIMNSGISLLTHS